MNSILIIGEFDGNNETHVATNAAIEHSRAKLGVEISYEWASTEIVDDSLVSRHGGLWIAPGSPYKSLLKTLRAIQYAREQRVPTFGTCGGFQHIMIEYARNVLGISDAQHAEYDPDASCLFISPLTCTLAGKEMPLTLVAGSKAAAIYGSTAAIERYYCNFAVHPDYLDRIPNGPMRISGSDNDGEARIVELLDHPFFIGTLFVPQARSSSEQPHPLVDAFISSITNKFER